MKRDPEAYRKSDKWMSGILEEHIKPEQQENHRKIVETWLLMGGDDGVEATIRAGAIKLYCLGEYQRKFYESHGFKAVKSLLWLDEYRPDGWNEAKPIMWN